MKVLVVAGTRPEAIKLAPVVRALAAAGRQPVLVSTGQHRELLDQALDQLSLAADYDLRVMSDQQRLGDLASRLLGGLGQVIRAERPDAVVVQGDTTTCLCGALAAFYERVPVGHVEAGLRSGQLDSPFPEEGNRSMVARVARWHFAPTRGAEANLRAEGIAPAAIELTGNTVVDSLQWVLRHGAGQSVFTPGAGRKVLVTLHRRESQGRLQRGLGEAIARLGRLGGVQVVLPLHHSPMVREALVPALRGHPAVRLIEPLGYQDFVATLADADLVLTDSGGLQEEASTFGKPLLVLRETTERPEAVAAGNARLVGLDPARVLRAARDVLRELDTGTAVPDPRPGAFGDGQAARRIVQRLARDLRGERDAMLAPADGEPGSAAVAGRPG